ncbi:MAG: hypothetical protein R3C19_04160 [Planctomycetaceae bacterium]
MSDISLQSQNIRPALPPTVRHLLGDVRGRLRKYGALSGLLLLISGAAVVFWLTTGLDSGWFALQKLELPVGLRSILLTLMVLSGGWVLVTSVFFPLLRRLRDLDLALLLERRFPQFQDRLVTTVQGVPHSIVHEPLVRGMLQRTISQAEDISRDVEPSEVFNLESLQKRGWIAGLLALSVAIGGAASPQMLSRWWNAFVQIEPVYHLRTTALDVTVIAQPGDRRISFPAPEAAAVEQAGKPQPAYLHPRGNDLELQLSVPDGKSPAGKPWVVPERVRVDVIRADGTRSRTYVSSTSDRTFRFVLTRLQESVQIELLAGDYRSPQPLRVEAVAPPSIDEISLTCTYPEYTGWNGLRERSVKVLGSEVSLPVGTEFDLVAVSNKPLQAARIVTDLFELTGDSGSCRLIPREGFQGRLQSTAPLLSADGKFVTAKFRITEQRENARSDTGDAGTGESDTGDAGTGDADTGDGETATSGEMAAFDVAPIPSNTSLRFSLHDRDDIVSVNPESLRIRGIADEAPVIATRIVGVENAVTRLAVIPVTGQITDDYGLAAANFEFVVDDATEWRPRPFGQPLQTGTLRFELGRETEGDVETFAVQPLDLTEGQTLSLTITATDGCSVGDPNVTRGEPVLFRIVSNEELLSLLYTREITLRRRFEDVIRQLEQVRDDLIFHRDVAVRIDTAAAGGVKAEDRIGLTTAATRSGNNLRRQNNELRSITEGFDDIVRQLINNAVPPRQLADKMRSDIVDPLQDVTGSLLIDADKAVSRFRVAATAGKPSAELVDESSQAVAAVIVRLQGILENVRDMAEFHEALRDLKAILEEQQRVLEETKRLRNKGFLEDL